MSTPDGTRTVHGAGRGILWIICLTYVALALLYNIFTPIGEAPDELDHFRYLRLVADDIRLPGAADGIWEGHQAPLYYVMQAAWARAIDGVSGCPAATEQLPSTRNPGFPHRPDFNLLIHPPTERLESWRCREWSYHLLRLLSTALTVPMILGIFAILQETVPTSPPTAAVGGMILILLPSHVSISAMLNNDSLVNVLTVGTTYLVIRACRTAAATDLAKALVVAGVATTAKLSGFYLFGVILTAPVLCRDLRAAVFQATRTRIWLLPTAVAGVLPLGVMVRNITEWGDPFALRALETHLAASTAAGAYPVWHSVLHYYAAEIPKLFAVWLPVSYGAINFPYGGRFEMAQWATPLIAGGILISLLDRARWRPVERRPLIVLVAGFFLFFGTYAYPGYRHRWLQVRFFFGQLPFLSLCAAIGVLTLCDLTRRIRVRLPDRLLIAMVYASLVSLNVLVLIEGVFGHLYRYVGSTPHR